MGDLQSVAFVARTWLSQPLVAGKGVIVLIDRVPDEQDALAFMHVCTLLLHEQHCLIFIIQIYPCVGKSRLPGFFHISEARHAGNQGSATVSSLLPALAVDVPDRQGAAAECEAI